MSLPTQTPAARRHQDLLDPDTLELVARLEARFGPRRKELLDRRRSRQADLDAGVRLDLLPETAAVRSGKWQVAPPPKDLADRRVEITGPPERRRMVHALNSGAQVYMADLEDALSPTWANVLDGLANIVDAAKGRLRAAGGDGVPMDVVDRPATLVVRPRGWHLQETHVRLRDEAVSASLFDATLFLRHAGRALLDRGSGPYLYLPKMESHLEARLWNEVLGHLEATLGLPRNCTRVSVLVETLPAAFEMEEILYELRERSPALNAGRWDYLFSAIKCGRGSKGWVLPDRAQVTMAAPFMRAYCQLLVRTCHRRGAYAIGGMAALVPSRKDPERNRLAFEAVRADKRREAKDGFDGTWVAHPDLVPVAHLAFEEEVGDRPNQLAIGRDADVAPADLLRMQLDGAVTQRGVRANCRAALGYLACWLSGQGAVALDGLMEDTATAEIARAQLWQWVHQGVYLEDDGTLTPALFANLAREELGRLRGDPSLSQAAHAQLGAAFDLLEGLVLAPDLAEFLTLEASPQE